MLAGAAPGSMVRRSGRLFFDTSEGPAAAIALRLLLLLAAPGSGTVWVGAEEGLCPPPVVPMAADGDARPCVQMFFAEGRGESFT